MRILQTTKKMKTQLTILILLLSIPIFGQTTENMVKGNVSFISSQNIYVRFVTTDGIDVGDTLFAERNDKLRAVLVVKNTSSISCICTSLFTDSISISTAVFAKKHSSSQPTDESIKNTTTAISVNDVAISNLTATTKKDSLTSQLNGRISVSSYTNISDYYTNERLKYNLSLNAQHIGNSRFSAETNISFSHLYSFPAKVTDWTGINNALKVYNLAVKYELNKTATIWLGRRINSNMANIGAVDGLQFENNTKNFSYGALVGSRPDYSDYSFNSKLLQYGAFIGHNLQGKNGFMQTSLGFFNQMNQFKTDRRFAYFQHSNSLLNNLQLFCSLEFDLYSLQNNTPKTVFDLTSTYVSLGYQPWKQLSLNVSYDARKNIYYYETFKNLIDSLLDKSTRQGFRASAIVRPFNSFTIGMNGGYRLPTNIRTDTVASMNANGYLSYSRLPLDITATLNATLFKTGYTNGTVYGASLSRDFFDGKLNTELQYRLANYNLTRGQAFKQNIAELDISWQIAKKLYLSADIEATLEKDVDGAPINSARIFLSISKRF